jgi:hypothetical protein
MEHGALLASIYWPALISQGDKIKAALEGSYCVPDNLERAQTLCALWAFNRVVLVIQDWQYGVGRGESYANVRDWIEEGRVTDCV